MLGRKKADEWSIPSKLKAFQARHFDITPIIHQANITQDEAVRALASLCAWVQNDQPESWLHFTSDQQSTVALPRDCAMDLSVPIVRILSYASRLATSLSCRKSLVNSVLKLPVSSRAAQSKVTSRTPVSQHRPNSIAPGFPMDFYQVCSQALEFKELQAEVEEHVADDLKPLAMLTAEVQALASEVGTLCGDYNALASRLERDGILEKLKSVNADCETFKANLQSLNRERTTACDTWQQSGESLKRVESELREQTERIRRSQGLLAKYSERISQSPEELSKKYDNLKRDKAGIYEKDAAQAHSRLRCARAVQCSLPETRAKLKSLAEALDLRSATVKNFNLEVARREKLRYRVKEIESEKSIKLNDLAIQQAHIDKQTADLLRQKEELEARLGQVQISQARLGEKESAANIRIVEIQGEMSRIREEDIRETRLERQLHCEADDMRKHLVDLRNCLPSILSQFDEEIRAHQEKIATDLAQVNEEAVRRLESLMPADYLKLRALKQGRICGC